MIASNSLTDFISYFEALTTANTITEHFVHGGLKDILSRSRAKIEYPCLWLEPPSLEWKQDGHGLWREGWYHSAFVIFTKHKQTDKLDRDFQLNKMMLATMQLMGQINTDWQNNCLKFQLTFGTSEPFFDEIVVDGDVGYRTSISVYLDFTDKVTPNNGYQL